MPSWKTKPIQLPTGKLRPEANRSNGISGSPRRPRCTRCQKTNSTNNSAPTTMTEGTLIGPLIVAQSERSPSTKPKTMPVSPAVASATPTRSS